MSMTREEAIKILQREKDCVQQAIQTAVDGQGYVSPDGMIRAEDYVEACAAALSALRPVSQEQVEKVWRGEWIFPIFAGQKDANDPRCQCSECVSIETPLARHRFCPNCGAPMTDEAVQMVMERLEALKDGKGD